MKPEGNHPPVKDAAIQKVNGYLLRRQADGTSPCFMLDPRFVIVGRKGPKSQPVMQQALRSGYIYDPKRNYIGTTYPHLRPAFKDGFYEHPCDSFLYGVIAFGSPDPAKDAGHLRSPNAIREAVQLFEKAGMYAIIPRDTDPAAWAAKVLDARARADRAREEARARRLADREDERREMALIRNIQRRNDPGSFGPVRRPGARAGYVSFGRRS